MPATREQPAVALPEPASSDADAGGRLIACVDHGPGGRAAVRLADSLATRLKSELLLVTVRPAQFRPTIDSDVDRDLSRDARAVLACAAAELDRPAELRVAFGEPAERLLSLASRERASLIVVGRPPRQSLTTEPLGNVYLALAGTAPCPAVVVPAGAEQNPSGPIVCGFDGSEPSLRAARVAAELARRLGVRLSIVHVLTLLPTAGGQPVRPHANEERAVRMLRRAAQLPRPPEIDLIVDHGAPADRLAEIAERESAQLVVTAAGGNSTDAPMLLGPVTSRLAALSSTPCLIVPPGVDSRVPAPHDMGPRAHYAGSGGAAT
jgi:nucleotide-binding universal stress UspA family protein